MSPFLLEPDIIGEDVVKLPISNNDLIFQQKTHENDESSSSSMVASQLNSDEEYDFDLLSKKLVGDALRSRIESIDVDSCAPGGEDSFFVADLGRVYRQYERWVSNLPRIEPCYAVKCNNDPKVLELLSSLGIGFDCASKNEIESILNLGVDPSKIVYAHPCKAASYIRYAGDVGVKLMTFDNADELKKCKRNFPGCKLLLRIMTDDSKSLCQFSIKYGASMDSAKGLLELAKSLDLDVVGVSFHVGSGASDPTAFVDAVENARHIFDMALDLGMPAMNLLDVGGGFVHETFEATAAVLGPCVDKYFPISSGVRVIAEPGRYFVSSAFTLAVNIVGRRITQKQHEDGDDRDHFMLYINDGVYANMNCIIFDHQEPIPKILSRGSSFLYSELDGYGSDLIESPSISSQDDDEDSFDECSSQYSSSSSSSSGSSSISDSVSSCSSSSTNSEVEVSIWGPTCDGIDLITKSSYLPMSVNIGDWLYFTDFGAYTLSASTTFNGFNTDCHISYVHSEPKVLDHLKI